MRGSEEMGIALFALLCFGIGFVLGGYVEGPKREVEGLRWALALTSKCEREYEAEGRYESVTECLEFAIWQAEDEIKARPYE